jgi:hypothetical protein
MLSFLLVSNFMTGSKKYSECFNIVRPMQKLFGEMILEKQHQVLAKYLADKPC